MDFKYPQTWWNLKSLPIVLYFSLWAKPSSDCISDGEGKSGPSDCQIDLAHVQKATITPYEDVVVAESEDKSASSGVVGDSSNSWDGEGEEGDDDWSEGFDHLVEVEAGGGWPQGMWMPLQKNLSRATVMRAELPLLDWDLTWERVERRESMGSHVLGFCR